MPSSDSACDGALGFSWDSSRLQFPAPAREPKKPLFMLRRLMAEYVWDVVHLEGNAFTFVDVQTLLGGTTVGCHRQADAQQVLNQQRALDLIARLVADPSIHLGKDLALKIHAKVAFEEALRWGCFRTGDVRISGTSYVPPPAAELEDRYQRGLNAIERIENPFERALVYFFWGALSQFFFDGNKRTSRAVMNFILLRNGYYYLTVPGERKDAFDTMMVDFYETRQATTGMKFMLECQRSWD